LFVQWLVEVMGFQCLQPLNILLLLAAVAAVPTQQVLMKTLLVVLAAQVDIELLLYTLYQKEQLIP
jgi:hypothetical protein